MRILFWVADAIVVPVPIVSLVLMSGLLVRLRSVRLSSLTAGLRSLGDPGGERLPPGPSRGGEGGGESRVGSFAPLATTAPVGRSGPSRIGLPIAPPTDSPAAVLLDDLCHHT